MSERSSPDRDDIIEVLECDLGARPTTAPGVDSLVPHVRGVARTTGALLVEFDEHAAETLSAFVDAERICCAGIGWEIERGPMLRLRITAGDGQLEAMASLWKSKPI
ncbi:MAG: hypothetical protein E6I09_04230 [Chloroflexi bacterium]|jgi:hypothetical protein|nr:MAG: hypothetical protein E6I09_04230 [Chloroflexota bacterium]